MIRLAVPADLPAILEIYAYARAQMKLNGNPTQWGDRKPEEKQLIADIESSNLYVIDNNGQIEGVFALIFGADPTYAVIKGSWLNDEPYCTIHRIATAPGCSGTFVAAVNYGFDRVNNVRVDTHENNKIMRHLAIKHGFKECGIIWLADGAERIAFQKKIEPDSKKKGQM